MKSKEDKVDELRNRVMKSEFVLEDGEEDQSALADFQNELFTVFGLKPCSVSDFVFDTACEMAHLENKPIKDYQLEIIDLIPQLIDFFDRYDYAKRRDDGDETTFEKGDIIEWCDQQYEVVANYGSSGEVRELGSESVLRFFNWSSGDEHSTLIRRASDSSK